MAENSWKLYVEFAFVKFYYKVVFCCLAKYCGESFDGRIFTAVNIKKEAHELSCQLKAG